MVVAGDVLAVRVSTRGERHAKRGRQAQLLTNESDLRIQMGQEQAATDGGFRSASPPASTVSGMAIAGASLEAKILSISVCSERTCGCPESRLVGDGWRKEGWEVGVCFARRRRYDKGIRAEVIKESR